MDEASQSKSHLVRNEIQTWNSEYNLPHLYTDELSSSQLSWRMLKLGLNEETELGSVTTAVYFIYLFINFY